MPGEALFSATYADARARFRAAALSCDASLEAYLHPLRGAEGEPLATDVASLGTGPNVVVVISGTHGIEGYAGSACQLALLDRLHALTGPALSFLLIHAVNPHGFSHGRRVDPDNVDVNRNFLGNVTPRPPNAGYAGLHDLLIPPHWTGDARAAADASLGQLIAERGRRAVQAAVTQGQYTHPEGLFYGGIEPVWSHTTVRTIIERHLTARRRVAVIDVHTGLGRFGAGEMIVRARNDESSLARMKRWFPDATLSANGSSVSTEIVGNIATLFDRTLKDAELSAFTLEFGTLDGVEVLDALRGDHWLHSRAGRSLAGEDLATSIGAAMRRAFYPADSGWKQSVVDRFLEAVETVSRHLREEVCSRSR